MLFEKKILKVQNKEPNLKKFIKEKPSEKIIKQIIKDSLIIGKGKITKMRLTS